MRIYVYIGAERAMHIGFQDWSCTEPITATADTLENEVGTFSELQPRWRQHQKEHPSRTNVVISVRKPLQHSIGCIATPVYWRCSSFEFDIIGYMNRNQNKGFTYATPDVEIDEFLSQRIAAKVTPSFAVTYDGWLMKKLHCQFLEPYSVTNVASERFAV